MKKRVYGFNKLMAILLSLVLFMSIGNIGLLAKADSSELILDDILGHWAKDQLEHALSNDLLESFIEEGLQLMKPNDKLLRNEMFAIITKAFGVKVEADLEGVEDIGKDAEYKKYIGRAVYMGIVDLKKQMYPTEVASREEAFSALARAMKLSLSLGEEDCLKDFTDKDKISGEYLKEINGLVKARKLEGYPDGRLKPKGSITRAEFATVMYRLIREYVKTPSTITSGPEEGSLLITSGEVILKNMRIKGDLIISEGVDEGEITLDGVKVEGNLIVRGGYKDSIIIQGHSSIGQIVMSEFEDQERVSFKDNLDFEMIYADEDKDKIHNIRLTGVDYIKVGESEEIKVSVFPETAINQDLKWTSSDEDVLQVSQDGLVTGKGSGIASITVSSLETGVEKTLSLAVFSLAPESDFEAVINKEKAIITKYKGNNPCIVIPSQIEGALVDVIGSYSFKDFDIKGVFIPKSVTSLLASAFDGKKSLEKVIFEEESQLENIYSSAFRDCNLSSIFIPKGVSVIGHIAFSGNENLLEVILEDGIQLERIESNTFKACKLSTFVIPDTVTKIQDYAFSNNESLEEVIIGENSQLEEIGRSAFQKCNLASFYIPKGVKEIKNNAFASNRNLHEVIIAKDSQMTAIAYQAFWYCDLFEFHVPDSVKEIGGRAFSNNINLKEVTFGEDSKLEVIDHGAFMHSDLSTINIPKGIKQLGEWAFGNCYSLSDVTLPEEIEEISDYTFYYCDLKEITIPKTVTRIGEHAFEKNVNLEDLVFEEGSQLKSIGNYAFSYCKLNSFFSPEGVSEIGVHAFINCNITKLVLPSGLEKISEKAFASCDLKELIIPKNVISIEEGAFLGNRYLNEVIFEEDSLLLSIGDNVFRYCYDIRSIVLPDSLERLGYTFNYGLNYIGLESITIGPNVEVAGYLVFEDDNFKNVYEENGAGTYNMVDGVWVFE